MAFHRSTFSRVRRGFTLFEAALATIIVGVSITAAMQSFATCAQQNRAASNITGAMLLASNVQEAMAGLAFSDPVSLTPKFGPETGETLSTFNDVDDFDGQTFNPPIDSTKTQIAAMSQFSQVVSVVPVYVNKPSSNTSGTEIPKTVYTGAVRVTVRVMYRVNNALPATEVYRTSWIRTDG